MNLIESLILPSENKWPSWPTNAVKSAFKSYRCNSQQGQTCQTRQYRGITSVAQFRLELASISKHAISLWTTSTYCVLPILLSDNSYGMQTSALTMNIAGVVKDWLLIGLSYKLYHSEISRLNLGGYSIAFLAVRSIYNILCVDWPNCASSICGNFTSYNVAETLTSAHNGCLIVAVAARIAHPQTRLLRKRVCSQQEIHICMNISLTLQCSARSNWRRFWSMYRLAGVLV